MSYFKKLEDLLKIEMEEDRVQFQNMQENASATEKRMAGLSWYPISIKNTELTKADYLKVEIQRHTFTDLPHQFKTGSPLILFSNFDKKNDKIEGTAQYVSPHIMRVLIKSDELPRWAKDGKLGVELVFDNGSYDEMFAALKQADKAESSLKQVLLGTKSPSFDLSPEIEIPKLNPSQNAALNKIVNASDLAVVHGPPGTGKTTTLVEAIHVLAKNGAKNILVTAPSNTAVDLLAEKLATRGLSVLRVGNPAKISETLEALTLEHKIEEHGQAVNIKKLKKQAAEYQKMAHKYKREFGPSERAQRKALFDEAYKLIKEAEDLENYILETVLTGTQIVAATLVGSNMHLIRNRSYDAVVIDEAGQALEPACWVPILKSQKLILAGDHCQLPPTIKSTAAGALAETLLEKVTKLQPEAVVMLDTQYRMHQAIMEYSSKVFYGQNLKAHESVVARLCFEGDMPVEFIDTAGCSYDETLDGTVISNKDEASLTLKILGGYIEQNPVVQPLTKALISPYRGQVEVLKELAKDSKIQHLTINTIDSFQGQERDLVFISLVRSNAKQEIGFLEDIRRMNVAMTRAKAKLVLVGDSATLAKSKFYAQFIEYVEQLGGYKSAWEFIY